MGLQLTVSATGIASQTVYADISSSSPLCSTSNDIETCVIALPTLATNEQFVALETDSIPSSENPSGYGAGFGTNSNILGAISQSKTVQLGASNAIGLELGPVSGHFYDCSAGISAPASLPAVYSANFGIDSSVANDPTTGSRIVVTTGVAATGLIAPLFCNPGPDDNYTDYDTTPAPFVDVNGSPTPITLTSNASSLTLVPIVNNGTAPPASAYAQTASIANDGFVWFDCSFFVGVKTSVSFSGSATIVVNNNLTAINPFFSSPSSYASTMTYTVAAISVSPTAVTVSADGTTTTANVTGTDFGAINGMDAESAYPNYDYQCESSGGTVLAMIQSNGSINTTTWQQSFKVYGNNNGTGTCTFFVTDDQAETVTQPITVTIN
jgi:hypothetical protein